MGLYYLNSRYYNPETGRFISSDGLLGELGDILSTNMYAYCANNPVMYIDPSGEAWWHAAIGAVVIVGLFVAANVLTCGFASVVSAAAWGALSGAVISGFFGGLSTNVEGNLTFNWENASKSFMVGAIAGGLGSASHLVGETFIKTTTLLRRIAYIGMQAGINSTISASVTAVSGLITHSFSWTAVGISAGFGAFAGTIGVFPGISDGVRGVTIGIGLGFAEGSINEAIEWHNIRPNNQSNLTIDYAY